MPAAHQNADGYAIVERLLKDLRHGLSSHSAGAHPCRSALSFRARTQRPRRRQWAWMRRRAVRSSGVPGPASMVTAWRRAAWRTAVIHRSHSSGMPCGAGNRYRVRPGQPHRRRGCGQPAVEVLLTDPLLVVMPERHPAAGKPEILAADLDGGAYFHAAKSACPALHDFVLHRVFAQAHVAAGQGFTIIFAGEARDLPADGTVRRPLMTSAVPPRLCAVWGESRSRPLDWIIGTARELCTEDLAPGR